MTSEDHIERETAATDDENIDTSNSCVTRASSPRAFRESVSRATPPLRARVAPRASVSDRVAVAGNHAWITARTRFFSSPAILT
jgi:hypothetical protein